MRTILKHGLLKHLDLIAMALFWALLAAAAWFHLAPAASAQETRTPPGFDPSSGGPPRDGPPSPDVLARNLIHEFDLDGNSQLSVTELASALKALHQRRPHGPPRGERDGEEGNHRPSRPPGGGPFN